VTTAAAKLFKLFYFQTRVFKDLWLTILQSLYCNVNSATVDTCIMLIF